MWLTLALGLASGFGLGVTSVLLLLANPILWPVLFAAVSAALGAASMWMTRQWMGRAPLVWVEWPLLGGLVGFFGFWFWYASLLSSND
jgi:hypothetical protein